MSEAPPLQSASPELEGIYHRLNHAGGFAEIFPALEKEMLAFLQAERITVYQKGRHDREIVSRYLSEDGGLKDIRLPLATTSIAGYVALSQKGLRIDDVYEGEKLAVIHPNLHFDKRFDRQSGYRTCSMIVTPIKSGAILLGVLQVINRVGGGAFSAEDLRHAEELALVIGQKFRNEFNITRGPYDLLVQKGLLQETQLEEMKERSTRTKVALEQLIIHELRISPEEVGASLEQYFQAPFMRYDPALNPPQVLLKTLNVAYLTKQLWVPVAGDFEKAVILIDNPSDAGRIMEIQRILNAKSYEFRVGLREDILRYLKGGGGGSGDVGNINDLVGEMEGESLEATAVVDEESGMDEKAPLIIKLVNQMIVEAHKIGASDIHIEPSKGTAPAVVRMRIDGQCRAVLQIPASHIKAVVARIKIMSRLDIAERRRPQDGKCVIKIGNNTVELRVATLPTVNGESAVMRVLASGGALPFDKLNLSPRNAEVCKELVAHPHGIFLVVGPTGSGKTTTLHAVLGYLNTPDRKIWTAEDPVEITQPGMCQVQVDKKIGFDFAAALRAFLRADPDIILIGEMRDHETAHSGIEASLTGHLVFSTLHTNSAPETITRLLDLGLDPMNFADALLGVLAQRLVRTLCGECKEFYQPDQEEFDRLVNYYGPVYFSELGFTREESKLARPKGCAKCGNSGYKGRTGLHELLGASEAMRKLVARKAPVNEMRAQAMQEGMRTILQDGVMKIFKGQTDIAQLMKVAAEK
ncbi:MAG: GspE/PulE family protein [Magnetococcales bacterium]|nr:GspE/PulE family protein [Magnetococcales bacterium]